MLDYLGGVSTPDLLPKIIREYAQTQNTKLKYMLLRGTQSIYNQYSALKNDSSSKALLINFYTGLLSKVEKEPEKLSSSSQIAALGLIDLGSKDIILANLDKINVVFDKAEPYDRIGFKCNLMLDIKSLEKIYIPEIMHLLEKENDNQLDERFFSYIIDALFKDTKNLAPDIKQLINNYLNSISYKFGNINHNSLLMVEKPSSLFAYGAWIEASALVNSNSVEEAGHYIAEFIKNKPSVVQANYIIGLSKTPYIKNAYKKEPVFLDFVNANQNSHLKNKNSKLGFTELGIQYAVNLVRGRDAS